MGEAAERQPLAVIQKAPVEFTDKPTKKHEITIPIEKDLYAPLLKPLME
jgi:F420-0:gamma-glutamyl ligase